MGACASVPKAMRSEAAAPAPEPLKEETTAVVEAPEVTTIAAEATKVEEVSEKKADEGDDKKDEKTLEVEAPKEATQAPATSELVAAAVEEKKPEVAEQK